MKEIVENLQKAELYEKAVQILNQMKDLYEFTLFDYDAVSKVLVSQHTTSQFYIFTYLLLIGRAVQGLQADV